MGSAINSASVFQALFNLLGWAGVSNTLIKFDKDGFYKLHYTSGISLIFHIAFRINYIVKMVYLVCLILGAFPNAGLEFLDKLTVGFWFLVFGLIAISEGFWMRKYPFFEIICAGWKIQNEVCQKVREPYGLRKDLQYSVIKKAVFQAIIMSIGTIAMGVQYTAAPKYPIFTGYLVEEDSTLMTVLFGFHDVGFLLTAWTFYGPVICLSSVLGGQLHLILESMTEELRRLPKTQPVIHRDHKNRTTIAEGQLSSKGRVSSLRSKSSEASYSIEKLLMDYKKLMIYMDRLNEFCAYKFLFIHITAYIQMIGDVFIMIQVLRSGEADFMTVFFYLEDCGVCMLMLFKCFKSMSLVKPSSDTFLAALTSYLIQNVPNKWYLLKVLPTLKPIALDIGPNAVGPCTVGNAMMVLLNYYIMAALW